MAAFTLFTREALERYLIMFGKGRLVSFEPVQGGIENSNYFLHLEQHGVTSEYVLTIMEEHSFAEVPFFSKVLNQVHQYGLPVAAPQPTLDGMTSTIFCGKPTFLFHRLAGSHLETISTDHCRTLGQFIASLHQALGELKETRDNPYNLDWMQQSLVELTPRVSKDDVTMLTELINEYRLISNMDLPRGLIHGDLFRDNALFNDHLLTGVIDFYHACDDLLVLDLAIAINDWCRDAEDTPDAVLREALIKGYESVRELTGAEHDVLLPLQQISAARFALTRLLSGDPPLKNPVEMLDLVRHLKAEI